jgi:hypothetical protein
LLSPIRSSGSGSTPPLLELMDAPFARQVTRTLARALSAAREATSTVEVGGTISDFGSAVEAGVTANLCEAVAGMFSADDTEAEDDSLTIKITWAPKIPEDTVTSAFVFVRADASVLLDGARYLREQAPEQGILITGVVVNLRREEDQQVGVMTVSCVIDGKVRKLHVPLVGSDYDVAIDAHRNLRPVLFTADVSKVNRLFYAANVRNFRLGD